MKPVPVMINSSTARSASTRATASREPSTGSPGSSAFGEIAPRNSYSMPLRADPIVRSRCVSRSPSPTSTARRRAPAIRNTSRVTTS